MPGHRISNDFARANALQELVIADPGASGTFDLQGNWWSRVTVTATGTYTLPNADPGTELLVCCDDTSTVTLADSGGSVATFVGTSGTTAARCTATDSNSWAVELVGAAAGGAAEVGISDGGSLTLATNVEDAIQELYGILGPVTPSSTTINNTDGTGTLTAASIVGGIINRTGETTAYTDTTVTGGEITAALATVLSDLGGTYTWKLEIRNTVAFSQTLAAGTDVTLAGNTVVPPNSVGVFLVSANTSTDAVAITGLGSYRQCALPNSQFSTSSTTTSLTAAAGVLSGSNHVFWENTADGAVALTTRTGALMFADIPNCHIGFNYLLTILNRGDNTVTLTAAASGVSISGEATVATTTTRTWRVAVTAADTFVITSVNKGTIET